LKFQSISKTTFQHFLRLLINIRQIIVSEDVTASRRPDQEVISQGILPGFEISRPDILFSFTMKLMIDLAGKRKKG